LQVPSSFWSSLTSGVGMYTVGEVFNGDIKIVAPWQGVCIFFFLLSRLPCIIFLFFSSLSHSTLPPTPLRLLDQPVSAPLSYPLFFTLRNVFAQQQSMTQLTQSRSDYLSNFKDINLLGTFLDNHDNPVWMSHLLLMIVFSL
jgi:alpha-amylase